MYKVRLGFCMLILMLALTITSGLSYAAPVAAYRPANALLQQAMMQATPESTPAPEKRNSGSEVAVWVAIGVAVFAAISGGTAASRKRPKQ